MENMFMNNSSIKRRICAQLIIMYSIFKEKILIQISLILLLQECLHHYVFLEKMLKNNLKQQKHRR